jgi:hypothetical protein
MMGIFNQASQHLKRPRVSSVEDKVPEDTEEDDTSVLCVRPPSLPPLMSVLTLNVPPSPADAPYSDEQEGSIITSMISQLRCAARSASASEIADLRRRSRPPRHAGSAWTSRK